MQKNMKLGKLNIPKLEIDRFSFVYDIQTRSYLLYADIIEKNELGKTLLSCLNSDPCIKNLQNKMISNGCGAYTFDIKKLAMWFLWAANKHGQKNAEQLLNEFLNSDHIPVINTLWVLGIEVKQSIQLGNGYGIIPTSEMPDSRDKELYMTFDMHNAARGLHNPKAAIVYKCNVVKTRSGDEQFSRDKDKDFWNSSKRLKEIAFLLNALDGISCIPCYATSYVDRDMPLGLFGASGGGYNIYDVLGYKNSELSLNAKDEIESLMEAFGKLSDMDKNRLLRVLSRLSQSKRRSQIEDKLLDLGIALEMVLLGDNKNSDQLSLSFRLRGSWLLESDPKSRKTAYCLLRDIYKYRSQVAHSGILCANNIEKIKKVREKFPEYRALAEKIVRIIILNGKPDWTNLILGNTQQLNQLERTCSFTKK